MSFKDICKKISDILKWIFGYGIMITLFVGGFSLLGYIAALFIGGDAAALICKVIYKQIYPVIIYVTTVLILLGLVAMYLAGEMELTAGKKKTKKTVPEEKL